MQDEGHTGLDFGKIDRIFGSPVCSENIFILRSVLNNCDQSEIDHVFNMFVNGLYTMNKSKSSHSPELLASMGVYLSIILRYNPETNLYINGRHFLVVAMDFYFPYVTMYITLFLIIAVIKKADILAKAVTTSNEPMEIVKHNSPEAKLKERVGTVTRPNTETTELDESVIDYVISRCQYGSPERKILSDLKRIYKSSPGYILPRIGLKNQKTELAIFLDDIDILEDELSTDDIEKAIFLHSNKVLALQSSLLKPHHFNRSIQCLNYDVAKLTTDKSDWISKPSFDDLVVISKRIKDPTCLDMILLCISKNMTLCKHHLKRIPSEWTSKIMEVYTTPRWKTCNLESSATANYYRVNLCLSENLVLDTEYMNSICSKLKESGDRTKFVDSIKAMNKSTYIFEVSSYNDFLSDRKITFSNTEDSMLNDVFEISRAFIVPHRERDRIYLFDFNLFRTLIDKRENPYNRNPIPEALMSKIISVYQSHNNAGLSSECATMSDFVQEMTSGRKIEPCSCTKNYRSKLVNVLKTYGLRDESIDFINLKDMVFKLAMISIDLSAETLDELCRKLYRAIKLTSSSEAEAFKRTIASIISIYNRGIDQSVILPYF